MLSVTQEIRTQRKVAALAARAYADYILDDGLWPVCTRGHDWRAAYTSRERHLFEALDAERCKLKALEGRYWV